MLLLNDSSSLKRYYMITSGQILPDRSTSTQLSKVTKHAVTLIHESSSKTPPSGVMVDSAFLELSNRANTHCRAPKRPNLTIRSDERREYSNEIASKYR